jgi:hypothetical protein
MNNVIGKSYSSSDMDDPTRKGGVSNEPPEQETTHPLDSQANKKLLSKLNSWHDHEWRVQSSNRYQMALDCDYYDGLQWSEEDAQILMARDQAPLVFNEIKPTIDWMLGTERRARIDHKIFPRKKDKEAIEDAENKSMLLKYLSDANKTPFHRSMAFDDCVKAGVGWIETGVRGDPTDELNYTRREDWRNCIHDSTSVEMDYSDARYFFRKRWLDDDIAIAYFPERKAIIESAIVSSDSITAEDDDEFYYMGARVTAPNEDFQSNSKYMPYSGSGLYQSNRPRVNLKECWYKVPVLKRRFNRGDYEGKIFNKDDEAHVNALQGGASLYDKLEMQVRCAIFCSAGLLYDGVSPYKHGRIPFVPVWCYRRKRDNQPYGAIRTLRDPQDDLNKRHSKAQWILSSNGIVMDLGAVDDVDELREEASRPDYVIVKNPNKQLTLNRDNALAQQHIEMMSADIAHIRNAGGVNNENLGRTSNASSGIALQERKESGSVVTTAPFDNLRFAVQSVGEMELSNIEQFYTEEKTIRVIGERSVKFKELNKPDENGNILNDITAFQADYVVSEQDYRSSLHQAMFESLFDMVGRLAQFNPQVALNLLDLVVEIANLPNKDELVARIRKINGQDDPDKEETPEEKIVRQAKEKSAQEKSDLTDKLALKTLESQLAKIVAEKGKLDAQALGERITAIYSALQAAGTIAQVPAAASIADEILKGGGYTDASIDANQQMIETAAQDLPQDTLNSPQPNSPAAAQGINAGIQTQEIEGVQK